jgi:hypothetical protein
MALLEGTGLAHNNTPSGFLQCGRSGGDKPKLLPMVIQEVISIVLEIE